ncbi:MAG: peptide-methionine (R)-S-oxide reductase MsrB [Deltaproteobacteria bacterium]|nr:peptide-methionine (R)-S-oxide reductase MsrB [Deltaproteobacteria bacterium]MBI3294400.1 peptide-methionine (R)-S-oxide reductase MsrB [Deltaproteobacteria bacterium]
MTHWKGKPDSYWREHLTPEEYRVCRQAGTEAPFSGEYNDFKGIGTYYCRCCELELFRSQEKFESGCGWPSFSGLLDSKNVVLIPDSSHGMNRTEVRCSLCNAHLGHVFDDGPKPTRKRYCINSVCLKFRPDSTPNKPK